MSIICSLRGAGLGDHLLELVELVGCRAVRHAEQAVAAPAAEPLKNTRTTSLSADLRGDVSATTGL